LRQNRKHHEQISITTAWGTKVALVQQSKAQVQQPPQSLPVAELQLAGTDRVIIASALKGADSLVLELILEASMIHLVLNASLSCGSQN